MYDVNAYPFVYSSNVLQREVGQYSPHRFVIETSIRTVRFDILWSVVSVWESGYCEKNCSDQKQKAAHSDNLDYRFLVQIIWCNSHHSMAFRALGLHIIVILCNTEKTGEQSQNLRLNGGRRNPVGLQRTFDIS